MTFKVLFACNATGMVKDGQEPICPTHGPTCRVSRALDVRKLTPRIVGMATGPHVQTKTMDPATPTIGDARLTLTTTEPTHASR